MVRLWCAALCLAGCGRVAFEAYCPPGPDGVCERSLVGPLDLGARPGDMLGMGIDWQGDRLLVGMPGSGLAKIAERPDGDAAFAVTATLASSIGGPNTDYGLAVALDGDRAIVGAHSFDGGRGAAAIFERSGDGSAWVEVAQLANPGTGLEFASAVALRGDRALIGAESADSAYVFERDATGAWQLAATLGPFVDDFGKNVVLDASGTRAFVSATWDANVDGSEAGSVRVFERSANATWSLVQYIQPPVEEKVDAFGIGMAVDGDVLAIGGMWASRDLQLAGVVIVYARDAAGSWAIEAILHDASEVQRGELGRGVALRGDRLVATMVRDTDGVLAVFRRESDGRWVEAARLTDPLGELAGYGTGGIESDLQVRMLGDTALVGAPLRSATNEREGAVVQYDLAGL